jgi:hypothetical protein
MLGAWGGHVVAAADAPRGISAPALRRRQLPLAVVMVGLTTLTLWSLGQALVVEAPANTSATAARPVLSATSGQPISPGSSRMS